MADPATIIGLASGIISFITFGAKVVSVARAVRGARGVAPEVEELNLIVGDVRALSSKFATAQSAVGKLREDDQRIVLMAIECERLAGELRTLLTALKMRDGARFRSVESGLVAFRALTKKAEIDDLRRRLDGLDMRLRMNVGQALQRFDCTHRIPATAHSAVRLTPQ
jgi:hypothetical protein